MLENNTKVTEITKKNKEHNEKQCQHINFLHNFLFFLKKKLIY